jgi:hypothetical protein
MTDAKFENIVIKVLITAIFIVFFIRIIANSSEIEELKNKFISAKYIITPEEYR